MALKAIIFGSINTIADVSALQLRAFNAAFAEAGLDWDWSTAEYRAIRVKPGSKMQIKTYAERMGSSVDAVLLHKRKTQIFDETMIAAGVEPRPGVVDIIDYAKSNNLALGFAADTMQGNIDALFAALDGKIEKSDFDFVANRHAVKHSKPHSAIYDLALATLGVKAGEAIAIEDNEIFLKSPLKANITAVAFPNMHAAYDNFSGAAATLEELSAQALVTAYKTSQRPQKLTTAAE